jgi:hypothetical protein
MANQHHLDILKQGTYTWNEWRREHPEVRPSPSRTNLYRIEEKCRTSTRGTSTIKKGK